MKVCKKCQTEFPDDMGFCSRCGIPLQPKIQEVSCPKCGKVLGKSIPQFCPYCGQSIVPSDINGDNTIRQNKPKEKGDELTKRDIITVLVTTILSTLATLSAFGFVRGILIGLMFVFVGKFLKQKRYIALIGTIIFALLINVGLNYTLGSAPKAIGNNSYRQNKSDNNLIKNSFNDTTSLQKVNINFPTGPEAGSMFSTGKVITDNWNKTVPSVNATVQTSQGSFENIDLVSQGKSQVSFALSSHAFQFINGTGLATGTSNKNLKAVAGLYLIPNQVVVTNKSGITKLEDIKGKRFAVASEHSSVYLECENHLSVVGLKFPEEIISEKISLSNAIEKMKDGTIDGGWIMAGVPVRTVIKALQSNCHLLNIDDSVIRKLQARYPWYTKYTIPAGTYPNQTNAINTSAIKMIMFCRQDLPEDTVYQLTKSFWEHIDEMGQIQRNLRKLTPIDAIKDISNIPLHPGAEKYYREIGVLK